MPILAYFVLNAPNAMLPIFDAVALELTLEMFDEYARIHSVIHVRITDLPPLEALRDLRHTHINCLVAVSGVVSRRTGVFPQVKVAWYNCNKCGELLGPFDQDTRNDISINMCPGCHGHGPFSLNNKNVRISYVVNISSFQ